jgi:hypothetical protein
MDYILEGHALRRTIQRKIPKEWITLTIKYGNKKKNRMNTTVASISKDKCQELIEQLIKKSEKLDFYKDSEEISDINRLISSIQELKDRGGIRVVYNPDTKKIITLYHKKEKIIAEFRVF